MNIVTAIGNENLNKLLKEIYGFNVIGKDIQYQEAVIEIIEKNKEIDVLILSDILVGELNIIEIINVIKYLKNNLIIFIILEKKDIEIEKYLASKEISNIYYNNKTTINEIIKKLKLINSNKINENKIIKNNKIKIINNKIKKNKFKLIYKKIKIIKNKIIRKNNKSNNKKIITIIGSKKIGKSIFLIILSQLIKKNKILLINFNYKNNNMKTLLGSKEKNAIIKWKKNVDILFLEKEYCQKENEKIENFYNEYDYILIEIANIKENKQFIKESDKIIIFVEPNLIGIKETKDILEEIVIKQKNQKDKIKIIFNKKNILSIKPNILKYLFEDFEIIGTIQYDKYMDAFINSNTKFIPIKTKNAIEKIKNKII